MLQNNMWLNSRAPRQLTGASTAIAFGAFHVDRLKDQNITQVVKNVQQERPNKVVLIYIPLKCLKL